MSSIRITFGIIVLNGEPFLEYNLHSLYPWAHQIIVVEGACIEAAAIATHDGHSIDRTLLSLKRFKRNFDIENKLIIVTAEDEGYENGFWQGEKLEMSRAYAKRATGNYLWQIDVDEFYKPVDMAQIVKLLENDSTITSISFPMITFWGGIKYALDGFSFRYTGDGSVHRLFKWGEGYEYTTHRPPTVIDNNGDDLRTHNWLSVSDMEQIGVYMYHYDMLLPIQAERKSLYYSQVRWHGYEGSKIINWKEAIYDNLKDPYHLYTVYTHYSWLNRFNGTHPPIINEMIKDIEVGQYYGIALRNNKDIDQLLDSLHYKIGRMLRILYVVCLDGPFHKLKRIARGVFIRTPVYALIQKMRGNTIDVAC